MLTGSILFYSFGEPYYLFLILCSILVNFVIGLGIENFKDRSFEKKTLLILSLLYNFGFLLFFKYPNFFIENINALLRILDIHWRVLHA